VESREFGFQGATPKGEKRQGWDFWVVVVVTIGSGDFASRYYDFEASPLKQVLWCRVKRDRMGQG
jgi:hypothetical protein